MGAVLPVAALALAAGGQLYQGYAENKAQRKAARGDEENARLSLMDGEQQVGDVVRDARFEQGQVAASIGQGLLFGGSVGEVLRESSLQAEMQIERVREAARGEARNYQQQAAERRKAGKGALIGAAFSALSTAVGGAANMRSASGVRLQSERELKARLGPRSGGSVPRSMVQLGVMP